MADPVAQGLFGLQDMMKDFYGYEPKDTDDMGRALKRGFQSDMIKKFADSTLATAQAAQDQSFQLDATKQLADLELRNQSQVAADQFSYGMQEMGARYDFESRMAVDDAARELNRMAMGGDIQSNILGKSGQEDRKTIIETGAQTRKTQMEGLRLGGQEERQTQKEGLRIGGEEQRKTSLATIGASGVEERARLDAQKFADEYVMRAGAQEQRQTQQAGLRETGSQERKTQREGLEIGGEQERQTIGKTAEEGRKTIDFTDMISARREKRESNRAASLANR